MYKYSNEEGMRLAHQLGNRAMDLAQQAQNAGKNYDAHMQLFQLASANNDPTAMENARETMHTCVDIICDAQVTIEQIRKEQTEILQSTNPLASRW